MSNEIKFIQLDDNGKLKAIVGICKASDFKKVQQ